MTLPITRDEAWQLVKKYNSDKRDLIHYLESEAVMREIAIFLNEDQDYYGTLGLVHDIDWGLTKDNTKEHLTKAPQILEDAGFDPAFIQIIISHGYGFDCADLQDKKRTQKIEHILAASETLTGIIHSYALMRDKRISNMKVKGLKKKFKDKNFAAGCHRKIIEEIELTEISLDQLFELAIEAIKKIKNDVGLE